jgi:hypothetical protein
LFTCQHHSAKSGIVVLNYEKKGTAMSDAPRDDPARVWRTPEGVHVDARGLPPPEPMLLILRLIDSGEAGSVLIAHLDREPIFLYPELDDRGWRHEIVPPSGEPADRGGTVVLRAVRWAA